MSNKVPTAEEFINTHYYSEQQMMIEFAKLHVKAALEAAAVNSVMKQKRYFSLTKEEQVNCLEIWNEDDYVPFCGVIIDKDSILNAYPDENIK